MKTTLNLGSFAFDFDSKADRALSTNNSVLAPQNISTAKIEIKDVSVTFEASVEETLEDIKAMVEIVKEMKSLGSEVANLFAGLESKRQERMHDDIETFKADFKERFNATNERIETARKEIEKSFDEFDRRCENIESLLPRDN